MLLIADDEGLFMNALEDATVLLVGDDADVQQQTRAALVAEGIGPVVVLHHDRDISYYLGQHDCELVMLDLGSRAPHGPDLVDELTRRHPDVTIVVVSGAHEAKEAAACIHRGAYEFILKPLVSERVATVARRALGMQRLRRAPRATFPGRDDSLAAIITVDPTLSAILAHVRTIAQDGHPILLLGETGTGKELLARAIHQLSGRQGRFVPVSVGGMDDLGVTDVLFGHRPGAFPGAIDIRPGLVLRASSGTLLLDDIGELSLAAQVRLLRLLQDGDYHPLGCDQPKYSSARVIAATTADLRRLKSIGAFRKDLFYRLCTHLIELPPLRERPLDVPVLMRHFVAENAAEYQRRPPDIGSRLLADLATYPFPGNVRELRSLVIDAMAHTRPGEPLSRRPFDQVLAHHLPEQEADPVLGLGFPAVLPTASRMQELLLDEALRRTNGNQAQAAAMLGLTRQAINKRVRR